MSHPILSLISQASVLAGFAGVVLFASQRSPRMTQAGFALTFLAAVGWMTGDWSVRDWFMVAFDALLAGACASMWAREALHPRPPLRAQIAQTIAAAIVRNAHRPSDDCPDVGCMGCMRREQALADAQIARQFGAGR